jgi:hypothetical protein
MPATIHNFLNALGSFLISPWIQWSLWAGLVVASLLIAVVALLVFRGFSNQEGIRYSRNRSIAALLDIPLYGEYPAAVFPCVGASLWSAGRYLTHALKPLLILVLPLAWALIQFGAWFTWQPYAPGDTIIATAYLNPHSRAPETEPQLTTSPEITLVMEPVRVPARREISWRLKSTSAGEGRLEIVAGDRSHHIAVPVGDRPARITPKFFSPHAWQSLLYGAPAILEGADTIRSVELDFPDRRFTIGGWSLHWIVVFLLLTFVFGLALSIPMRVEL